jgi:carbonic anhydrase
MISKLTLILSTTAASGDAPLWDYVENGDDWPLLDEIEGNLCGSTN